MDATLPTPPPPESTDVFSLSDQVLSDRLQFIEEIGFGNWGSVWLCRPKPTSKDGPADVSKLAVKLVHRSKTSTTAARVRSLWNEMKIVKTFKSDPHPSIIPFHSFIITPSYALITMPFLPALVPVEVDEIKAREWFRFLLSGVEFLHKRGVVHNDIKPANILLSHKNIPVLVDFGFAEKYDLKSETAFHSNLSYGTPEYLSPERARGLPHDTRKSDVWSLGVTFFEILIGRTPFENSDGEQFTTKEDLELYWSRTLRGKWVGEWRMSKGMERMLRRMIFPNADLRCNASQIMNDAYWAYRKERVASPSSSSHRRSTSYTSSIIFEKDSVKLMDATRPSVEELPESPPGLDLSGLEKKPSKDSIQTPQLSRVRSQPKVTAVKPTPRKRVLGELSPVKGSPPSSPFSAAAGKENIRTFSALPATTPSRRPLSSIANRENTPVSRATPTKPSQFGSAAKDKDARRSRVLGDLTSRHRNMENSPSPVKVKRDPVRDRVKEWERERQRMREMERLEELERERDEVIEVEVEEKEKPADAARPKEVSEKETRCMSQLPTPSTPMKSNASRPKEVSQKGNRRLSQLPTPSTPMISPAASSFTSELSDAPRRMSVNSSGIKVLKLSIRKSIDKTMNLYKSSAAQLSGRSTPMLPLTSTTDNEDNFKQKSVDKRESWEDEILLHNAPSSLPSVRQAVRNERVAVDAHTDRMTIWMRNVEKVVEDARQTFASSSSHELTTLPSLPIAPLSRSNSQSVRSSRLPRKILPANQIFNYPNEPSFSNVSSSFTTPIGSSAHQSCIPPEVQTPRRRRATVSIYTPEQTPVTISSPVEETGSPSKRREKSKSHGNLFSMHIAPVSLLDAEINKAQLPILPPSAHRLSDVLDSSLFIAPPLSPKPLSTPREDLDLELEEISRAKGSTPLNDLESSPQLVEPYPARRASMQIPLMDTPTQRRVEGVYDRFLMATSGVKRVGKGYQSENTGPVPSGGSLAMPARRPRPEKKIFHATRKPMPAAVSNDLPQRKAVSVDELGIISRKPVTEVTPGHTMLKDDGNPTVALVKKAIKAFVPNKSTSKRLSRIA